MSEFIFDVLEVGREIPSLVKHPTTQQLVMWAGASGDYNPIHYDKDFAMSKNLPGVVVHGQMVTAFMGQMLSDWMGVRGSLRKLSVSYKGMNFPGDTITCRGVVNAKSSHGGKQLVTLDVWVENPKGEKTVVGTGVVEFSGQIV
jgi:acyl dehydratase